MVQSHLLKVASLRILYLMKRQGQILDEQSGDCPKVVMLVKDPISREEVQNSAFMGGKIHSRKGGSETYGFKDKGGASRFFYCPKTPKKERNCYRSC